MIWGLPESMFTMVHVVLSLVGIATGLLVVWGFLTGRMLDRTAAVFFVTTILTSVTGFGFPFDHMLPSHKVGIVSLVLLALAVLGKYAFHAEGGWRRTYVFGAVFALYLNIVVLVVQLFRHVPALNPLAPTQTMEPAFLGTQIVILGVFLLLGWLSLERSGQGRVRPA
jgi:hypothetical protein